MDYQETVRRMHSGKLYDCNQPQLQKEQLERLDMLFAYNQLPPSRQEEKTALLREMLAEFGEGSYIETPFHANWGGKFVHVGRHVYANFNLTLVDDTEIDIGSYTEIGPNVTICTGTHPIHPPLRRRITQYNLPVKIGENVWIGAGSVILPGVFIGGNSVIGAGSVVVGNIPPNVVAVGNPCRVLREIGERDREYYHRGMRIDPAVWGDFSPPPPPVEGSGEEPAEEDFKQ